MAKAIRKALSKKIRFEVFKRDGFQCQYCGESAPKAILHIDHIEPVASGGDNNILNLITSCQSCNLGKGKRELSDKLLVSKQMDQMREVNERSEQLKMIAKWRSELISLEQKSMKLIRESINAYISIANKTISDEFLNTEMLSACRKYGLSDVLSAIDKSAMQYLKNPHSAEDRLIFYDKIIRICYWQHKERENPEMAKLRYLVNLANKRWNCCDTQRLLSEISDLYFTGAAKHDELATAVMSSSSYSGYRDTLKTLGVL